MELPRRPHGGRQVWRVQTSLRFTGQLAFPSHRRRAVLPRHARLGHNLLRILTDVWLPDFKFGPRRCAMTLAKTPWYWETVTRNIALLDDWGRIFPSAT